MRVRRSANALRRPIFLRQPYYTATFYDKGSDTLTYEEAVEYINQSYKTGKKHTLDQLRATLRQLGDPQNTYRIIHVAGTNGKGSVCAMLSSILREAGYKTGLYTSPHLIKVNERFSINGRQISDEAFAELAGAVRGRENASPDLGAGFSFFEILTLMGFLYFAREHADFAVIETGIGGRLDATNAVEHTFLSVITSIGYDHCELLGGTLEAIASEKAGIIKKNTPVVLYLTTEKVYNKIQVICHKSNSKLYYLSNPCFAGNIQYDLDKTVFSVTCDYFSYKDVEISLLGRYQAFNACHVLLCVKALRESGVTLEEAAVRTGLKRAVWPGRMEVVHSNPLLILDGAHNVSAAGAFCQSIEPYRRGKRHIVAAGMLKTKDAAGFMKVVSPAADFLIFTQPSYAFKALPAHKLAECAPAGIPSACETDCRKAVDRALAMADSDTVVSVVGSLYLVGDVKKYFAEVKNDRLQGGNSEI